jgi:hypothetical protein
VSNLLTVRGPTDILQVEAMAGRVQRPVCLVTAVLIRTIGSMWIFVHLAGIASNILPQLPVYPR